MARDVIDEEIVESRDDLARWFEAGCKGDAALLVGTEHEKVPFYRRDAAPVPYGGDTGIRALLEGMNASLRWERIEDGGNLIGLYDAHGGGAISLEPGGQFELSGAPLETAHESASETRPHLAATAAVAGQLGIGFLALGMSPKWTLAETPGDAKGPLRDHAALHAEGGDTRSRHDVPHRTVQANLDFADEADMVAKLRVGPRASARRHRAVRQFALRRRASRTACCRPRSRSGADTDPDRTGMLPFVFEPGFGFERYVDYALDVPMYFVKRGGRYIDVAGASFRDLLAGKLAGCCLASGRPSRTGQTTSRPSFRRCGSSAIWRCAAPTSDRRRGSSRCRR